MAMHPGHDDDDDDDDDGDAPSCPPLPRQSDCLPLEGVCVSTRHAISVGKGHLGDMQKDNGLVI